MKNQLLKKQNFKIKNTIEADRCFQSAKQMQLSKDYQNSIKLYCQAIIHNPSHYQSYANLGSLYKELGNINQAIQTYLLALNIKKDDYKVIYNMANIYRGIGHYQKALKFYQLLVHFNSKEIPINFKLNSLLNLGVTYQKMENYQQAIFCYKTIIQQYEQKQAAYYNYAICLINCIKSKPQDSSFIIQKTQQALNLLQKVVIINKNNILAHIHLIELKYIRNNTKQIHEEAVKSFKQILITVTDAQIIKEIHTLLRHCLQFLGRKQQSKFYQQNATKPRSKILQKQSKLSLANKENNIEEQIYNMKTQTKKITINQQFTQQQELLKQNKQYRNQLKDLGQLRSEINQSINKNNFQSALQLLQQCQKSQSKYQEIIITSAKALEYYNDIAYAIAGIHTYQNNVIPFNIEKNQKTEYKQQTHKALGDCYAALNNHQSAIKHYLIAYKYQKSSNKKIYPNFEIESGLGLNYEMIKNFQQAIFYYQIIVQKQPQNYQITYNLANCYYEFKQFDKSFKYFKICTTLINPKTDIIILGDCLINISYIHKHFQRKQLQLQTLQNLISRFDQQYNNSQQLIHYYSQQVVIQIFLQLVNLYVNHIENANRTFETINSKEILQIQQKLHKIHQKLLQFPEISERQQIIFNCGNYYYKRKCYLNAILYFKLLSDYTAIEFVALAYFHINQYRLSYQLLTQVVSNYNDPISAYNLKLLNWVIGNKINEKQQNLITQMESYYNCECDSMSNYRYSFYIQFMEQMISEFRLRQNSSNNENIQINADINSIILKMKSTIQITDKDNKQWKHLMNKFNQHCQNHCQFKQNIEKILVTPDIISLILKKSENIQQDINKLYSILNNLNSASPQQQNSQQLIQIIFCLFIINNSSNQSELISKLSNQIIEESYDYIIDEIKCEQPSNIEQISLENPSLKNFIENLQLWEQQLELIYAKDLEVINRQYYNNSLQISQPLMIDYNFPRCQLEKDCDECFLKYSAHIHRFLDKSKEFQQKVQNYVSEDLRERILESFYQTYQQNKTTIKLNCEQLTPVIIDCHFHKVQSIQQFINNLQRKQNKLHIKSFGPNQIIVNKFIKIVFHVGSRNFLRDFTKKCLNYPFGIKIIPYITIQNLQLNPFSKQNTQCTHEYWNWLNSKKISIGL